jgi:hypothetical protein
MRSVAWEEHKAREHIMKENSLAAEENARFTNNNLLRLW